jgi:hypothetical protein
MYRFFQNVEGITDLPCRCSQVAGSSLSCKQSNFALRIQFSQLNREIDPIHSRQSHIDDCQMRDPLRKQLQGLLGRVRGSGFISFIRENNRQAVGNDTLIVDNQDAFFLLRARHPNLPYCRTSTRTLRTVVAIRSTMFLASLISFNVSSDRSGRVASK